MAYRIDYGAESRREFLGSQSGLSFRVLTAALLVAFSLVVTKTWPEGRERLQQALLPGEPSRTEQAFTAMAERISQGEPVGEAVTAFCREVLENAELPE